MMALRVVLAKPGLDGHDRGIKVIAMALRDAGVEVVYLGLRRQAAEILAAAEQEDADVVGVSVLSGAHTAIAEELVRERAAHRLDGVPIVMGGTIPPRDQDRLLELGIDAVFPVGTNLKDAIEGLLAAARMRRRE